MGYSMRARRTLVSTALLFALFYERTISLPITSGENSTEMGILGAFFDTQIEELAGKVWNLELCPPEVDLRVGDKRLNHHSFNCTLSDATTLVPLLNGESLEERTYVWCRTALLYHSQDPDTKIFDVEKLNLFDGDIMLTRDSVDAILSVFLPTPDLRAEAVEAARDYQNRNTRRRPKRKVIALPEMKWPNAEVPYSLFLGRRGRPLFDLPKQLVIREAISHWERNTCIRFTETIRTPNSSSSHIFFVKGQDGCSSAVGRQQNAFQIIRLSDSCFEFGTVVHELGHALGFFHEHARPDRDEYVKIVEKNIKSKLHRQFQKEQYENARTYGVPYDYSSVMHYISIAFGVGDFYDPETTIITRDPEMQKVIGQRAGLSFLDVKIANFHYCSDRCGGSSLEWAECKHDGYRDPNDCSSCMCPSGLAPPTCEGPAHGHNADCDRQTLQASGAQQFLTSPGYHGDGFPEKAFCSWLIKTSSPGKQIKLQFADKFNITDDPYSCIDYVEVRYKGLGRPGPRFCGAQLPEQIFTSHGTEMLIVIHTELEMQERQVFKVRYVEEYCGGCSVDALDGEPPCLRMVEYSCNPSAGDSPCYREDSFCCHGYRLEAGLCRVENPTRHQVNTTPGVGETTVSTQPVMNTRSPTSAVSSTTTPAPSTTTTPSSATTVASSTTPESPSTTPASPSTTPASPSTTTAVSLSTTTASSTKPAVSSAKQATPSATTATSSATTATSSATTATSSATTATPSAKPTTPSAKPETSSATVTVSSATKEVPSPTSVSQIERKSTSTLTTVSPVATPAEVPNRIGEWGPWSKWTECSATCGLCGRQHRRRVCHGATCFGNVYDVRSCANSLCPVKIVTRSKLCWVQNKTCTTFDSSCFWVYPCYEKAAEPRCCVGTPENNVCVRDKSKPVYIIGGAFRRTSLRRQ